MPPSAVQCEAGRLMDGEEGEPNAAQHHLFARWCSRQLLRRPDLA